MTVRAIYFFVAKNRANHYRFGFNGQEKDNEFAGNANSMTAEFWQYDSRLGRRWKTDPVVYPMESLYATFRNNPIFHSDPNGNLHISKNAVATAKSSFNTTVSTLKVIKGIGAVASVGGGVISFYLYIEGEISGAKITVDFVMPGVALVPDLGWAVSGAYFIVDGTIGRDNAFETFNRLDSEHRSVTGKRILQGPIW